MHLKPEPTCPDYSIFLHKKYTKLHDVWCLIYNKYKKKYFTMHYISLKKNYLV